MAYTVYNSQDSFEQLGGVLAFNLASLGQKIEFLKRATSAADIPAITDALDRFNMTLHVQAIMLNAMSDFAESLQVALYKIDGDSAAPDEAPNDSSAPTGGAKADASASLAKAAAALADALKAM